MSRVYWLVYAAGLCLAGILLHVGHRLATALPDLAPRQVAVLFLAALVATILELRPTRFYFGKERSEVTLTSALFIPVLLTYGWPYVILLVVLSVLTSDLHSGKPWYKALYNTANISIAFWAAGQVYDTLLAGSSFSQAIPNSLWAATVAGCVFAVVNSALVALVLAQAQALPFRTIFIPYARAVTPFFAANITLSVVGVALWNLHPLAPTLLLPGLLATKLAYDNYVRLRMETDNFLHALADAVDLRDPYTAQHSVRVAELARALGERLGLQGDALWGLHAVARVHDVGKITVPDAVLLKAGPLDPPEYEQMKGHVEAGVRILQNISLYRESLDILAQHHERLDGSGYPLGLRDDEIIFPARVLAVADAYDAMTTDRPYRRAKTPEEALRELYRVAGKEYDLNVVRALEDELIARGVLKGPVIPAALEAARAVEPAQEQADAAARAARVVPLPRMGSGRKSP